MSEVDNLLKSQLYFLYSKLNYFSACRKYPLIFFLGQIHFLPN